MTERNTAALAQPAISNEIVVLTRTELARLLREAEQSGLRDCFDCFHPREFDVVVRAWPVTDYEPDETVKRGFEVITPFDGRTTQDRLDVGEMIRAVLNLTGLLNCSPFDMRTPEGWAEYEAQSKERQAQRLAEAMKKPSFGALQVIPDDDRAEIVAPYVTAIRELLVMFDRPGDALTELQHKVCAAARALIDSADLPF